MTGLRQSFPLFIGKLDIGFLYPHSKGWRGIRVGFGDTGMPETYLAIGLLADAGLLAIGVKLCCRRIGGIVFFRFWRISGSVCLARKV